MTNPEIGRAPHWWERLLQIRPRIYRVHGVVLLHWLGGIVVLRKPKP